MPVPLMWDGATDGDDTAAVRSVCVTASDAAFRFVAGILLRYATKFPDRGVNEDVTRKLTHVDQQLRSYIIAIGQQLLKPDGCGGDTVSFKLRQNPENDCMMQQSFDGGESWEDFFDMSLCAPQDTTTTQVNNFFSNTNVLQQNYQNYVNNYTDSVTNIYPDLGYDGDTDQNQNRNTALCWSLGQFVDAMCASALKWYDDLDGLLNAAKIGAALAAGLAGLIGLAAGGFEAPALSALAGGAVYAAAGIAIGAAVGEALYGIVTSYDRSIFEDIDARQEVVCFMYDRLKDADLNRDVFGSAIQDSDFPGTWSDNAFGIAKYCELMIQQDATYANFIPVLEQGYRSARVGLLPDCPCVPSGWTRERDLTLTDGDLVIPDDFVPYDAGVWNTGIGWEYQIVSGSSILTVALDIPATAGSTLDSVELDFELTGGSGGNSAVYTVSFPGSNLPTGAGTYTAESVAMGLDLSSSQRVIIRLDRVTGTSKLTRYKFIGSGDDPFA